MIKMLCLFPLLALAACQPGDSEPKVTQAWVRLPAVAGQPAAAYFTVQGGSSSEKLLRVESALANRIEMHESMTGAHNMAMMKPLDHMDVPAGTDVVFAPGGNHAMVYGLDKVVTPGTAVPLRFGFASGKTAEAEAKTVDAAGAAPY